MNNRRTLLLYVPLLVFVLFSPNVNAMTYHRTFSQEWHIITIPCSPDSASPAAVFALPFGDVLGFSGGKYVPIDELGSVGPGKGYWAYFDTETAVEISGETIGNANYEIGLQQGWNLIGSPFSTSDWSEATLDGVAVLESPKIESSLFGYNTIGDRYEEASVLNQWYGYFVKTNAAGTLTIVNGGEVTDPDQPVNVQVQECEYGPHTLLCVTWDPAQNSLVNGYRVFVFHDTETYDAPYSGSRPVSVNRYTVGGLTPGETYGIEVTSVIHDNNLISRESEHSDRDTDDTVSVAGNAAVVTFRAVAEESGGSGRIAGRTSGDIGDGLMLVPGADVELFTSAGFVFATATTDEFGWTEFSSLDAGSYRLEAVSDMGTPGEDDDIKVHLPEILVVAGGVVDTGDEELRRTGHIQGIATLEGETDHSGISVVIPYTGYSAVTDTGGSYTIMYVPVGTWSVTASKSGYSTETQYGLEVEMDQTVIPESMELLKIQETILSGVVLREGETDHSGTTVTAKDVLDYWGDGTNSTTSATGSFYLSLNPDYDTLDFKLTASFAGFSSFATTVTVIKGTAIDTGTVTLIELSFYDSEQRLSASSGVFKSISPGDVDGDSDIDLIAGGSLDDSVLLNDGEGDFSEVVLNSDGGNTQYVVLSDLDSDGDLDYIAGNEASDTVWLNSGSGTFTQGDILEGNIETWFLCASDLDNDGDSDIIQATEAENNRVWLNDGSGMFSSYGDMMGSMNGYSSNVCADLDADGDIDFADSYEGIVWNNNGNGLFSQNGSFDSIYGISAADLDSDSDLDLISLMSNETFIYENNGSGSFSITEFYNEEGTFLSAGDFDIDGDTDLHIVSSSMVGKPESKVLVNDGSGSFLSFLSGVGDDGGIPIFSYTFDADGDGRLDITYLELINARISVWLGDINGNNPEPAVPSGAGETVYDGGVLLSWSSAYDAETPPALISYNVAFSSRPGVVSTSINPPFMGNTGATTSLRLKNLEPGMTYYWAVQAVDGGFEQSPWSNERSFITP